MPRSLEPLRPAVPLIALILLGQAIVVPQTTEEDFHVWTDHPRLFLNQRRLRLLKRERERESIRWLQFHTLLAGGAPMPEPGFAAALYYQVSGEAPFARRAIDWAVTRGTDLRQLALVFDWCRDRLSDSEARTVAAKIRRGLEQTSKAGDLPAVRARALAAIAISETAPEFAESELKRLVREWWRTGVAPGLKDGRATISHEHTYALFELLHAVRDNLQIDLRDSAPKYFTELPAAHLLSHYPATFPAAENEYRIPAFQGNKEPDLDQAALSRAGQLALVAYDTNARENQYVQGWLIHDRFLMRGTFGISYEFLWANPYQPGLSYYHLPLLFYDPRAGRLFVRSNWDDDAVWFGLFGGQMQVFEKGQIHVLDPRNRRAPLALGEVTVVFNPRFHQSAAPSGRFYVVGLKPRTTYNLEVEHEGLRERTTDAGGVLELTFPPEGQAEVRISAPAARSRTP
ncbi:MAG: hypothetical protein HY822_13715 [Acidobacteria bacterium]|nr:hypothetical protein [Acidobacteriota bacterium]